MVSNVLLLFRKCCSYCSLPRGDVKTVVFVGAADTAADVYCFLWLNLLQLTTSVTSRACLFTSSHWLILVARPKL